MVGSVENASTPQFMLVLSSACPAECSYCFGPHSGPVMPSETLEATLEFIARHPVAAR